MEAALAAAYPAVLAIGRCLRAARESSFTKRLVFSAWQVVPKAVAMLLSYEVERAAISGRCRNGGRCIARPSRNQSGSAARHQLSAVSRQQVEAATFTRTTQTLRRNSVNADDLVAMVRTKLQRLLEGTIEDAASDGPDDDAWYWAAPILLDLERAPHTRNGWARKDLSREWKARVDEDEEEDDGGWEEHVAQAKRVLGGWKPTGRPPADLVDVLAKLAVAGPAVCALRSLSRLVSVDDVESEVFLLDGAGRIAWALRSMFNRPESMAVIRETAGEGAFWKQVLGVLPRWWPHRRDGRVPASRARPPRPPTCPPKSRPEAEVLVAAETVCDALTLRSAPQYGRALRWRPARRELDEERRALRTHFAKSFGRTQHDDKEAVQRDEQVRAAFNSPFWPVLSSTSIGQEGLVPCISNSSPKSRPLLRAGFVAPRSKYQDMSSSARLASTQNDLEL